MDNSGCSLSLNETNYPSNTLSTFVSAHYICSVKCAPLLREVGFADGGSQAFCLRAASLHLYTPCLVLRRTQIIFSGARTGNPWLLTFGNGVTETVICRSGSTQPFLEAACCQRVCGGKCRISKSLQAELCHTSNNPQRP